MIEPRPLGRLPLHEKVRRAKPLAIVIRASYDQSRESVCTSAVLVRRTG